ncbi:MAG: DUF262 domain-containing protein [Desulfovibrio sp.]|jgi:hypothetical protein|nr:DUF262 domain-containing protein [Desulfovibrio sp.]
MFATCNFDSSKMTLRHLLTSDMAYTSPSFQNGYTVTEGNCNVLWKNITALFDTEKNSEYYMGCLVILQSGFKEILLLDGQQRLTTLSIMILAMLKYLEELAEAGLDADNNTRRVKHLQNSFVVNTDLVTLASRPKLLFSDDNTFFQTCFVPHPLSTKNATEAAGQKMRDAYTWFLSQVQERFGRTEQSGVRLAAFLDSSADRVCFTVITVNDETSAFRVFETFKQEASVMPLMH